MRAYRISSLYPVSSAHYRVSWRSLLVSFLALTFSVALFGCAELSPPGAIITQGQAGATGEVDGVSTDSTPSENRPGNVGEASGEPRGGEVSSVPPKSPPTQPGDPSSGTALPGEVSPDPTELDPPKVDLLEVVDLGVTANFRAVWVAPDTTVWAAGDTGAVVAGSDDEWHLWNLRSKTDLNAVYGDSEGTVYVAGSQGLISRQVGEGWDVLPAMTNNDLNGLWFSPEGTSYYGFAVGDNGTLLVTGGYFDWWSMSGFTNEGPLEANMNAVGADADGQVFAVGDDGIVMRYNGKHWAQEPPDVIDDLIAVTTAAGAFWVIGRDGHLLRYSEQSGWTNEGSAPVGKQAARSIAACADGPCVLVSDGIYVPEEGPGWFGMDLTYGTYNALSAGYADDLWAVGDGGVLHALPSL